jgi:alcohol dehydrogenase (NADP+)
LKVVGKGLAGFVAEGRRGELFVTSKVWNTHHRPAAVR